MTRGGGIVEVVDEILSPVPNAAGLGINWQIFGSNGQEKADYSRGVLDRFTRRAKSDWTPEGKGNAHIKTVANPRMINIVPNPHFANYFEQKFSVNENRKIVQGPFSQPVAIEKIVINHYHTKSREEYKIKMERGRADTPQNTYNYEEFKLFDQSNNDEFDDGILKYRDEREKIYRPPDNSHVNERLLIALMKNLLPTLKPAPQDFYAGKMETFLTCRAVASYLKTKLTDDAPAKFFEETSIQAILKSTSGMTLSDARLLIRELPNLLKLPYPVVKDLRNFSLQIIPQLMNVMRLNNMWKDFVELDYISEILKE